MDIEEFQLNDRSFKFRHIQNIDPEKEGKSVFEKHTLSFLKEWFSKQDSFQVKTSGSTGPPKEILLTRNQLIISATTSIKALGLSSGDTSFLCLPSEFIAGKMMIVRSLVGNLPLVARDPTGNPFKDHNERVDFTALVPLQLSNILESNHSIYQLNKLKVVLIGGGPISSDLETACNTLQPELYHTYGMTETATHVALRKLNGPEKTEYFHVLPGISIHTDQRECLTIKGEITLNEEIVTNDLVELLNNKEFKWLGRIDHVINTGGIKVIPEELELKISNALSSAQIVSRLFIHGVSDQRLGQRIILIIESGEKIPDITKIRQILDNTLLPHERPKEIIALQEIAVNDRGKINRNATLQNINFVPGFNLKTK